MIYIIKLINYYIIKYYIILLIKFKLIKNKYFFRHLKNIRFTNKLKV